MKVVLELQDQPSNVRRITVRHDIVIGRGSDCNLRLSAPQVSRRHCFLRVGSEGVSVSDLDSSNGTFVDGKRIKSGKRVELQSGSSLAVGPVRFVVHVREEAAVASDSSAAIQAAAANSDSNIPLDILAKSAAASAPADEVPSGGRLNLSVEQACVAAEEHKPTEAKSGQAAIIPPEIFLPPRRNRNSLLDSRAEVIDLGKRIAELEAAAGADADTLRTRAAGPPPEGDDPPTATGDLMFEDLQVVATDDESSDPVELADPAPAGNRSPQAAPGSPRDDGLSEDELLAEEIADVEDVEIVEEFVEVVEDVDVVSMDAQDADHGLAAEEMFSDSDWFGSHDASEGTSGNDDDMDPRLRDFLKGL